MRRQAGFTVVELLVVIAIIAILASAAVPRFAFARREANESAAIATLRNLVTAQQTLQTMGVVDVDRDGEGEHAFLAEIAGSAPVRGTTTVLEPPSFSRAFGAIQLSRASRSSYLFQVFLPAMDGRGVAEDPNGGKALASAVDPDLAEIFWCAYAWPANREPGNMKVFFANQTGEILAAGNEIARYDGDELRPRYDAAFLDSESMIGLAAVNAVGRDGETWRLAR
ncbi:MAG: prepilin-type N-terminal cleavage/methylation domain-containing protein [Planctomycetes bacterium]|nr:prepilin-type N-terminal cleavage/methylation domain-containing protein [Planctomycetota bacterium]